MIGRKRVYVYPNSPPFLTERQLEDIALFEIEVDLPYEPWYDEHARVLDLEPGQMLSWPLNAPHRVENLDCLNVSMTVSFTNEEIHRLQNLNLANGLLRHRLGIAPKSRSISGPSYWSKAVLQKALAQQPLGQARAQCPQGGGFPPRRRQSRRDHRRPGGGVTVLNRELGHSPAHGLRRAACDPGRVPGRGRTAGGESAFRGGFAPTIFQTATWLDSWYETLAAGTTSRRSS